MRPVEYEISIRCEHVTRDGTQRSARIGRAMFTEGDWILSSSRSRVTETPYQVRAMPPYEKATRHTGTHYQAQAPSGKIADDRAELACATCRQRIVAKVSRLNDLFEKSRHAGVRTLLLSEIRANL